MLVLLTAGLATAGSTIGVAPARGDVTTVGSIAYSSDRGGTRQLYAVNPIDGTTRAVTTDSRQNLDPAWSPDGSSIAYAVKTSRFSVVSHIYLLDPSGQRHQLTTKQAVDRSPAWSPDGTRIAFSRSSGTGGD